MSFDICNMLGNVLSNQNNPTNCTICKVAQKKSPQNCGDFCYLFVLAGVGFGWQGGPLQPQFCAPCGHVLQNYWRTWCVFVAKQC